MTTVKDAVEYIDKHSKGSNTAGQYHLIRSRNS